VTHYELTTTLLSVIGILLIPVLVLLWRAAVNWTKLSDAVKHIMKTNDDGHKAIVEQMAYDRKATNERLLYLERYFMEHGMRPRR
jgi:hypothetical protein